MQSFWYCFKYGRNVTCSGLEEYIITEFYNKTNIWTSIWLIGELEDLDKTMRWKKNRKK